MTKKRLPAGGGIMPAVIVWLLTAGALLVLAAVAVLKSDLRQESLSWLSAAIVFFASAAAAWRYSGHDGKKKAWSIMIGPAAAVLLLTIGFIVDSEKMTIYGLARVVLSSCIGAFAGAALSEKLRLPGKTGKRARKRKPC